MARRRQHVVSQGGTCELDQPSFRNLEGHIGLTARPFDVGAPDVVLSGSEVGRSFFIDAGQNLS